MKAVNLRAIPVAALWIVPVLVVIEAVNLNRPALVWQHWPTTVDVFNGSYVLVMPLAAGVSCLATIAVVHQFEMVAAMPDGGLRALSRPGIATACVFSAVHLVGLGVVVVVGLIRGVSGFPNPLPVVVVIAAFFAASAIGTALAKLSPNLTSPPLVVLALYAYEVFEPRVGSRLFSDFGGASVLLLGLKNDEGVIALQTVWLASVALLLIAVAAWGWRAAPSLVVGGAIWVAFIGSGSVLALHAPTRFTEQDVHWACSGFKPRVCVAEEFENELPYFAPRVSKFAHGLESLGLPDVPLEFRQIVGADRPSGGFFGLDRAPEPLAFKVLESSVQCSTQWSDEDLQHVDTVVAYLVKGDGGQLYPQQDRVDQRSARAAVAQLAC